MGVASNIRSRIAHAVSAFTNYDEFKTPTYSEMGPSYPGRADRTRMVMINDRSIIASIYTRLAIDVAAHPIRHVTLNENEQFTGNVMSGLNDCLSVEANLDQAARSFIHTVAEVMFTEGVAAIVPTEYALNGANGGSIDIRQLRVGRIVDWFPRHVRVRLWNPDLSKHVDLVLEKRLVAIVENPLYSVMNERNSTLQRLIRKLNLLDTVDEKSGSAKLDMILQLPYAVRGDERVKEVTRRRDMMTAQLKDSEYGVAWIDGTEKVIQLNRPVENNLLESVKYLVEMVYGQLGITEAVMNGTADAATMINYYNRTLEPVLSAITDEIKRKFLSKNARTRGQSIEFYRDYFKLIPIEQLAEIIDKLTRNEVASANEIRAIFGWKPSTDPKANQLINSNLKSADTGVSGSGEVDPTVAPAPDSNAVDELMAEMDRIIADMDVPVGG